MEHTEYFSAHLDAWQRWAALVEDDGVRAEIVDGESGGYVVRWWTPAGEEAKTDAA